jgi:hypothetical protein
MLGMKVEKKTIQYFGLPIGTHYKKIGDLILFFPKSSLANLGHFSHEKSFVYNDDFFGVKFCNLATKKRAFLQ